MIPLCYYCYHSRPLPQYKSFPLPTFTVSPRPSWASPGRRASFSAARLVPAACQTLTLNPDEIDREDHVWGEAEQSDDSW